MRCSAKAWLLAGLVLVAGCAGKQKQAALEKPPGRALLCYVGVNMKTTVDELARDYELRTGIKVVTEVNDPRPLIDKIEVSKTADLFVCHDPFLPMLVEHGVKIREAWTAATLVPTIAVRKGNPKGIHGLEDLAKPGIRVGLTDQTSMSGNIMSVTLKRAGIEEGYKKNVVKEFPAGRQLGQSIMADEIDAGVIWNVVIQIFHDKLEPVAIRPEWLPQRGVDAIGHNAALGGQDLELDYVRVTVAVLGSSEFPQAAKGFAEFVAGTEGKKVFARNGFGPVDATRPALLRGIAAK